MSPRESPVRAGSQFAAASWGSWTQAPLVSKARSLLGCPKWSVNPSPLREKLQVLNSLLIVPGVDLWQDCVSASPLCFSMVSFLLTQCAGVTQLVSGFLQRNCSICSYRFGVSVGGSELGISLCRHLEQEPPMHS